MTDEEKQQQNDIIEGLVNQRNAAQNECVQLNAQLKKALRQVAELEAKVEDKRGDFPKPNGHISEQNVSAAH